MVEETLIDSQPGESGALARIVQAPSAWVERLSDRQFGTLLLVPAVLMVAALYLFPLAFTLVSSLQERDPFGGHSPFVGLENYRHLFTNPGFWNAFKNGLVYAVATVLLQVLVGLGVALLLNEQFRGNLLARTIIMMPYVMAPVAAALIWKWLLNDILGLVNYALVKVHLISQAIPFLGDPRRAMSTVIAISIWKLFPFVTIIILARLRTIPGELYDAAKVDGAGVGSRFLFITLPHLRGVLFIVLLLRSIWMFNDFETIWLLTKGGPINYTTTLPIFAYSKAFTGAFQISLGAATTVIMLLFLLGVASVYFRFYSVEEEIS